MTSSVNLFVANLDKRIDDRFLRSEFMKFGEILSVAVAKDEIGASKGFGFIHFASMGDGLTAMLQMNGKTLLSKEIHVNFANSQVDGRCSNQGRKNTMWASNFDVSQNSHESEWEDCVSDNQSQVSDIADDLNRSGISDVKERMRKLFETQCYTDVTFYPKNNRKLSISAHRAVLAVGSPLFTKMLFGDEKKDTAGMKMEVQISNLSFEAFTNIVKYLYTDEIFFENDSLVHDILQGARQFSIHSLVKRCKSYFESMELTHQNVCSKLQLSVSNKIDVLKEKCLEFIQRNTYSVINSADFQRCSSSTIRVIFKLQTLNLRKEKELLDALMRWLQRQPVQNRKQLMEPLLKCIRFLTFSVSDLGEALKIYTDIMTPGEGLEIMLYLTNPPKTPDLKRLPSWCNKNASSRCFFSENDTTGPVLDRNSEAQIIPYGRVIFPLKSSIDKRYFSELTCLLQMKCVSGMHQLKAIKLSFQTPVSKQCMIGKLSIRVHVSPSGFVTYENIQIGNSETVRVEFNKMIKVRRGDLVDIEAEAKDIRLYRFLQFDEANSTLLSPYFQCYVSSRPKENKLYFISEVEYGPQDNRGIVKNRRPNRKSYNI